MPKITALNELPTPEAADKLAIVDDSAITTKYLTLTNLLKLIYPVGSIYTNASNDTSPATLFGFGTWVAFGAGRVPVGQDTSDADFDTLQETGGSKNVQSHIHTLGNLFMPANQNTGVLTLNDRNADAIMVTDNAIHGGNGEYWNGVKNTNATGSGANNMNPYIVVHMWKRTA